MEDIKRSMQREGVGRRKEDRRDRPHCHHMLTVSSLDIANSSPPIIFVVNASVYVCMCICVGVPLAVLCEKLTSWWRNLLFNKYSVESQGEEPQFVFPLTSVLMHVCTCFRVVYKRRRKRCMCSLPARVFVSMFHYKM